MSRASNTRRRALDVLHRAHLATAHRSRITHLADALAAFLPGDVRTVLDVGSGDGLLASELASRRPELHVRGIDVVPRREAFIEVTLYDGQVLPFDDESFDLVLFVDVLHHAADQSGLLREAARVTRRYVAVKDHLCENRVDEALLRAMDWVGNRHNEVALPYDYWSADRWRIELPCAGLAVERFDDRVRVYPWPVSVLVGRGLHVLCLASTC